MTKKESDNEETKYGLLTEVGDLGLGFENSSDENTQRIKKELNKKNKSNS